MRRIINLQQSCDHVLIASIVLYNLVVSYLSIVRFESFSASVYDLGIMIQTIWNTSQGWILQESVNMGYPMMRFWMAHWEFIYLPVALIYKIFSSPYTILIIQTLVVSLGALPIYWLAKEKINQPLMGLVFSISYLLYPAIQNANLCDVHGVTFAAPFLLFAFYYLQKRNMKLFAVFAFISILCREDSALIIMMMGCYLFIILKERKIGIITAVAGFAWFFIWYERMTIRSLIGLPEFIIMEGAEAHWDHLSKAAHNPLYIITFLAKKYNIRYFFYLFGPVAFLSFLSPTTLLIASPLFAINLLSSYYYTHDVEHYYSVTIAPFIYISAIFGLHNLMRYFNKVGHYKRIPLVVLLCSLIFFFLKSNAFDVRNWKITEHHRMIKKVIREIPVQASLCAESRLAVHAAERHELYVFNDRVNDADYILYDFYAPSVEIITRKSFHLPYFWPDNDSIRNVLNNPDYGIIKMADGICLFKKGADYREGLKILGQGIASEIRNPLYRKIGSDAYCKGYRIHDVLTHYVQPDKFGSIYWKKAVHFSCYWTGIADAQSIIFRIQNHEHQFSFTHIPLFGLSPSVEWMDDELIRDEIFWEIPREAEPGRYQVFVSLNIDLEEHPPAYLFDCDIP